MYAVKQKIPDERLQMWDSMVSKREVSTKVSTGTGASER